MKHTKGPWIIKHEFNVQTPEGRGIAACGGYSDNFRDQEVREENLANAVLITASPDLLHSLKSLVSALTMPRAAQPGVSEYEDAREYVKHILSHIINHAEQAIDKAEKELDHV